MVVRGFRRSDTRWNFSLRTFPNTKALMFVQSLLAAESNSAKRCVVELLSIRLMSLRTTTISSGLVVHQTVVSKLTQTFPLTSSRSSRKLQTLIMVQLSFHKTWCTGHQRMEAICFSKSQIPYILSSPAGSLKLLSMRQLIRLSMLMITYFKRLRD